MNRPWNYRTPGIPDQYFIRGRVPMTKEEVRALVMGKLRLKENSVVVDVGAGTGSVSIEAALCCPAGRVYGIECKKEAIELLHQNREAFGVNNFQILEGRAAEQLPKVPFFHRIFVGGSGGEMEEIVKIASEALPQDGRIVLTSVTIESTALAMTLLKQFCFREIEVVTMNIARGRSTAHYTLMEAQNPISIISATGGIQNE